MSPVKGIIFSMNLTPLRGDIWFWSRFAPWYERWLKRGMYHAPIISWARK
ncbi:MAG: hypothetical protein WC291_01490 [Thermodesulfovibrionales bacterium]